MFRAAFCLETVNCGRSAFDLKGGVEVCGAETRDLSQWFVSLLAEGEQVTEISWAVELKRE